MSRVNDQDIVIKEMLIEDTFAVNPYLGVYYSLAVWWFKHRDPTQSVCVADCYFIVNVLDLPFASPIAIYR